MSRVIAAAATVIGGSSIALGGTYLARNGFGESVTPERKLTFKSVEEFKDGWKTKTESKCVVGFFEGGFGGNEGSELQDGSAPDTSSFFKGDQNDADPYKSCLIIDWKREEYTVGSSDKWKGTFTWTWTFVKGNEGFVNFNIAETSSSGSEELVFKGIFYLLEKEAGTNNKWEIKYKKEVTGDSKKATASDLDSYFPKRGTGVTAGTNDYWGFFKGTTSGQQLKNICGASDCKPELRKPKVDGVELHWTGSKTTTPKKFLKDWSSTEDWWGKIYESTPWSLKSKIEQFEGVWIDKTTKPSASQESQ